MFCLVQGVDFQEDTQRGAPRRAHLVRGERLSEGSAIPSGCFSAAQLKFCKKIRGASRRVRRISGFFPRGFFPVGSVWVGHGGEDKERGATRRVGQPEKREEEGQAGGSENGRAF